MGGWESYEGRSGLQGLGSGGLPLGLLARSWRRSHKGSNSGEGGLYGCV